ncbi:hypothetical protein QCN29_27125 [Streptomyces sp. HNM0663]|uniref:Uncharacterized protein n=1 Tax=Streptomyces chengmaiensis TaxID=3040919 RepID=A0ABT6HUI7_9ACTN|nr:hypothetical protein [Streptomyces chengmaiensis]MDH2392383.1 hypothetical protein [Streptomyces chengmaiensis]
MGNSVLAEIARGDPPNSGDQQIFRRTRPLEAVELVIKQMEHFADEWSVKTTT